jgi:hypothetical protein
MKELLRKLLCLVGRHPYRYVGNDRCDEVYRCALCGKHHVVFYTLRINRLGDGGAASDVRAAWLHGEIRYRSVAQPGSEVPELAP